MNIVIIAKCIQNIPKKSEKNRLHGTQFLKFDIHYGRTDGRKVYFYTVTWLSLAQVYNNAINMIQYVKNLILWQINIWRLFKICLQWW